MINRAQQIADELAGTCHNIQDALHPGESDNQKLLAEVFELVFECEQCGWWDSTDELNNDSGMELCQECAGE